MRYLLLVLLFAPALCATTYSVGPSQTYTSIGAVPWENITAGDIVEIHWRSTPYAEKFVICAQGTQANPIIVRGIVNGSGDRPILTGQNATTRSQLNFWNENRCVIKIGGASTPSDTTPSWITVENLEIRSAHPNYTFTNAAGASGQTYSASASSIYIEKGNNISVRNCIMTDCGNGFFVAPGGGWGDPALSQNIYVGYNYIHGNGVNGSILQHNSYCEAYNIIYEYNRYGPLLSGAGGGALKDRGAGVVIRYNWIESGNRQIDLVEAEGSGIEQAPNYSVSHVYGNVLIEPDGAGNSQIIHYGGDNGTTSFYRKGTLYLYNNTIYSTRSGNTTLVRLSTNSETCDCRNNIVVVSASASNLGLIDDTGTLNYRNCFFKGTPTPSHSGGSTQGTVNNQGGNVTGSDPGWTSVAAQDFTLTSTAASRDGGTTLHASVSAHPVSFEYVKHQLGAARASDATLDIGAYEFGSGGSPTPPTAPTSLAGTATGTLGCDLSWTDNSTTETGFRIERRMVGGSYSTLTTVSANATSYSDSGLTNGVDYNYRVFAYNGGGDSSASNEITITGTSTPTAPAAPTNCSASALAGLSIAVNWTDASSNEDGFYLERSDGGGAFTVIQTLAANATSFTDNGLTDGVLYGYRVRAFNTVGNSTYSNTASATASPGGGGGSGSGGGRGGGGGCSSGTGAAWWLLLLIPLGATRLRRTT